MEGLERLKFPWTDRRVLVTGATGLIGTRLVHRLCELGADVIGFARHHDDAMNLRHRGGSGRCRLLTGRLECFDEVRAVIVETEIDTIFHLGAQTIVGAGRRDPLGTLHTNILGTAHVLEACRLYASDSVRRIIVASSDKAYGEAEHLPYTERTPLGAVNPYDVSKSCTDLVARSFHHSYGLPVAITRCGNVYGPGDLHFSRLVPGTIRDFLRGRRPVIRSDGTPLRDYIFVDDAVEGYLALAHWLDQPGTIDNPERAFNLSADRPLSVLEMIRHIQRATGCEDLDPIIENSTTGEIARQHLDSSRALDELGWSARADLDVSLIETAQWYRTWLALDACEIELKPETASVETMA